MLPRVIPERNSRCMARKSTMIGRVESSVPAMSIPYSWSYGPARFLSPSTPDVPKARKTSGGTCQGSHPEVIGRIVRKGRAYFPWGRPPFFFRPMAFSPG